MIADHVYDQVVDLAAFGDIFFLVVGYSRSAPSERTSLTLRVLQTPCTSAPIRLGDLHGEGTQTTRRTVDQYFLSWLKITLVAQGLYGRQRGNRQ